MTFIDAYNYLLSLSNLPRKEYMTNPKNCSIYLQRLQFFLDMVGNPEKRIPHYIHITGTSGKGSTTSFLHSILHASGKKVGSTYSPHPTHITERWKIGNQHMSKKEFVSIVEELKPMVDAYIRTTPYDMLSFFELTEVIGFLWFARQQVEWVVLEVACGGRYDSSNVIPHKDVAIITNIGLDHVGIIGNTKEEICYEKAGIIGPGCTVFTSERNAKLRTIIKKECTKQNARLHVTQNTYRMEETNLSGIRFVYKEKEYLLPTIGEHQVHNAILCIDVAEHLGISKAAIQKGLRQASQPLRMEVVQTTPYSIILDGAHNKDKIAATVASIQTVRNEEDALHLVLGFSADKQCDAMIQTLATLRPTTVACTRNTMNQFRKVTSPREIETLMKKHSPKTRTQIFLDPIEAYAWSQQQCTTNDLLLVTGSIFLSGQIRGIQ